MMLFYYEHLYGRMNELYSAVSALSNNPPGSRPSSYGEGGNGGTDGNGGQGQQEEVEVIEDNPVQVPSPKPGTSKSETAPTPGTSKGASSPAPVPGASYINISVNPKIGVNPSMTLTLEEPSSEEDEAETGKRKLETDEDEASKKPKKEEVKPAKEDAKDKKEAA